MYISSCLDCHLKFHPHCINKAPLCLDIIPQTNKKPLSRKSKITPLGPLNGVTSDIKKIYLPVNQQQPKYQYKSEGYTKIKITRKLNPSSSIMT